MLWCLKLYLIDRNDVPGPTIEVHVEQKNTYICSISLFYFIFCILMSLTNKLNRFNQKEHASWPAFTGYILKVNNMMVHQLDQHV